MRTPPSATDSRLQPRDRPPDDVGTFDPSVRSTAESRGFAAARVGNNVHVGCGHDVRFARLAMTTSVLALVVSACSYTTDTPRAHTSTSPKPRAAPSTTTTTGAPTTYVVKRGDTLAALGKQFHVPPAEIAFLNGITDANKLTPGQSLTIPWSPPLKLVVRPATGAPGDSFRFELTGALPAENVTFVVHSPSGTYTGPPHPASEKGDVSATYITASTDPVGILVVTARGDQGSSAQAAFAVAAPTTHT